MTCGEAVASVLVVLSGLACIVGAYMLGRTHGWLAATEADDEGDYYPNVTADDTIPGS